MQVNDTLQKLHRFQFFASFCISEDIGIVRVFYMNFVPWATNYILGEEFKKQD